MRNARMSPIARNHPHRVAGLVALAGLVAAAVGDAAPEGLEWDGPGPAIFGLLALLVAVVRDRSMVLVATLVSAVFLYGALVAPGSLDRLAGTPALDVGSAVLQLCGLGCAVVAGVVALRPVRS